MDLISRKEVVSQIEFWLTDSTDYKSALEDTLERVKNTRSAFDGMSNGETIMAIHPNETMFEQTEACTYYGNMRFDTSWWNAPYKAESGG